MHEPSNPEPDNKGESDRGSQSADDWITLGRISGLYGVKGWVKIHSWTMPPANILNYPTWYLRQDDSLVPHELNEGRPHGKGIVARLDGHQDRDQAATLVGLEIAVPRRSLPPPAQGEYYWSDLMGMEVINLQGINLGTVAYLLETGANDVMVINGERERLVPFVQGQYVKSVDLEARRITVDWDAEF